jgi:trehalose 6-phosphate phosphatase
MTAPPPANAAFFLDIDGTLLDIAQRPELVVIPPGLPALLARLGKDRGGALAIVSGRPLADIDFFFPGSLPAAAEHGAILRDAAGTIRELAARPAAFPHWRDTLQAAALKLPGVLIEEKKVSLVIHYRQAPDCGEKLRVLAEGLIAEAGPDVALLKAHMAFELRPRGSGKDSAVSWFMAHPPFAGRKPVFIGDDVTDEPAIALANELGGMGLHVARDFAGSPQAVRDWLAAL